MRTEDLIVQLAGSAGAIAPLAPPWVRLARWAALSVALTAIGVVIGARADVGTAVHQPEFLARLGVTLAMGLVAGAAALVLSIPGAERSPLQHWAPLGFAGAWAILLIVSLSSAGSALVRLTALPFHPACAIEILALALPSGWALVAMMRRGAPLRAGWSAGIASLAAAAFGAAGTQLICPIDDPAHQLVGHFAPAASLAIAGALVARRAFEPTRRAGFGPGSREAAP